MDRRIVIAGVQCAIYGSEFKHHIAYLLYPMEIPGDVMNKFSQEYGISIVVITGMDWESAFSPWPAKGVPAGSPDFKGESPEFLKTLQSQIIPTIETVIKADTEVIRSLIGVSMSGLFTLWQWILCDTFENIASLSGSFWYSGFIEWIKGENIPEKSGKAFFLLGDKESRTPVKAFQSVATNTQEIVSLLESAHINVEFKSVPGNHYADPVPRLALAFKALFASKDN